MPAYYPVYLNLNGKKCLVVGGGVVAERKVLTLLDCGANVKLISPALTPRLGELAGQRRFEYVSRTYQPGDSAGSFLVVGATDNRKLHEQITAEAESHNILVNIVDVPDLCNFIVPSIVSRGDLQISISTGGKSPAMAKKIRRELERQFGDEYAQFLELMGQWRQEVLEKIPDGEKRREVFQNLVDSDILHLLKEGRREEALRRAGELMGC
ncbi:MAG: bifunctional precorrin-2 dehydrogenase/sirohydrochlorin ferrochelatase [Candidatus Schekmanbacteria bacterium]|nr:bifunctional precorrin-2 dehydrogenase/sirohydrochlorin ferrochelatase [Candidatus Schekmanbacteria bacterium]